MTQGAVARYPNNQPIAGWEDALWGAALVVAVFFVVTGSLLLVDALARVAAWAWRHRRLG